MPANSMRRSVAALSPSGVISVSMFVASSRPGDKFLASFPNSMVRGLDSASKRWFRGCIAPMPLIRQ